MGRFDKPKSSGANSFSVDVDMSSVEKELKVLTGEIRSLIRQTSSRTPATTNSTSRPIVNVPAPVVNVPEPDMSAYREMADRLIGIERAFTASLDRKDMTNATLDLTPLIDEQGKAHELLAQLLKAVNKSEDKRIIHGGSAFDGRLKDSQGDPITSENPLPVTSAGGSGLTDDELRASDVAVTLDGESVAVTGTQTDGLTDAELRADPVDVIAYGTDPMGNTLSVPIDGPALTDNSVNSGTLVSGATPAFDAVGPIVASNVIDTGWVDLERWNYQSFRAIFDVPGIKVFLMDASDTSGNHSTTTSFAIPSGLSPAIGSLNIGARYFQKYFRIVIINDTGTDATDWAYQSKATQAFPGPVNISLDQQLQDFFPAPVVRAVSVARQSDGDYVNSKATGLAQDVDGVNVETTATLGTSGTYESGWVDTDGWDEVEVVIAADQVSASDGIHIEFTDDAGATTPTVRASISRSFSAADVTNGSATFRFAPRMDGFKISYTNGGVAQGSFYLGAVLRADNTSPPRGEIEASVNATSEAVVGRDIMFALDPQSGQYENITRWEGTDDSGESRSAIDVNIAKGTGEIINASPTTARCDAISVNGTTPVQLDVTQLANRKAVSIANNGNKKVYIGFSSGITLSTGSFPLPDGQSMDLDLTEDVKLWAISDTGTQSVRVIQTGGTTS